jgi:ABC-2 type transport system ATP-binding protein
MIEVENLTKYYGPYPAIRDVSFKVDEGEVVAFLGPNGAGKTTTMRILTSFSAPTSGKAPSPASTCGTIPSAPAVTSATSPRSPRCTRN